MSVLNTNLENRESLIKSVKEELIGPTIDFQYASELNEKIIKEEGSNNFYYWIYGGQKEEIFNHFESPARQYASGLLYPSSNTEMIIENEKEIELNQTVEDSEKFSKYSNNSSNSEDDNGNVEFERQEILFGESSFGITFAVPEDINLLNIIFNCGSYSKKNINKQIQGSKKWLFRKSLKAEYFLDFNKDNIQVKNHQLELYDNEGKLYEELQMRLDIVTRKENLHTRDEFVYLVTVTVTNITKGKRTDDINISFQNELSVESLDTAFIPYPSASELEANISKEDKMFDMLYSTEKNYSFGQNCSAIWDTRKESIHKISSTFLPEYETYTISPDININGNPLKISHAGLASSKNFEELESIFKPLLNGYEEWIEEITSQNINPYYNETKKDNLLDINDAIERIKSGLNILKENKDIFNIFKATNLVMLMQMVNGKDIRKIIKEDKNYKFTKRHKNIFADLNFENFDTLSNSIESKIERASDDSPWKKFKWRGFQIAFLLMSIESIVNKKSFDRNIVDLIWFPTGGGKTEAYLGVAAFSMLYRRFIDKNDVGVDIIMRYTLRLLTADQFQRSARLISSLEYLRANMQEIFGEHEYSIGLWVGGSTSPNTTINAKTQLNDILKGKSTQGFTINSCPWCGAEIRHHSEDNTYPGYAVRGGDFVTYCPDSSCHFHESLPLYFIDEQIYEKNPTFVIGTVDKFVRLTWDPRARTLFGLNTKGKRVVSPPNLIIQDELHLISGPLGTLTGIYESLIEELCTDYRNQEHIAPKIISATATIKAYKKQIEALFGRDESRLFPPTGININDNFFSTIKVDSSGEAVPGKKYAGVFTTTQGLLQTQVQVITRLITSVNEFEDEEKDPFWTILAFYNSLREIGTTLSLTEQDIPFEMTNYYNKRGIKNRRYLNNTLELTSRISNDEVVKIIDKLKTNYSEDDNKSIDLTLASNIIEVGIDVDRLALMLINGQPRSTSQYIQVTGRIGRKPEERPGLVLTLYNPQKSNDKSHYEHFTEYHQRLYGQVEESSVTPFSYYAIERGLTAVIIGYLRQFFDAEGLGVKPMSEEILKNKMAIGSFIKKIIKRAEKIDDTEVDFISQKAKNILSLFINNSYEQWRHTSHKKGALVYLGLEENFSNETLPIINTMRSVDANSKLTIKENIIPMTDEDWGF